MPVRAEKSLNTDSLGMVRMLLTYKPDAERVLAANAADTSITQRLIPTSLEADAAQIGKVALKNIHLSATFESSHKEPCSATVSISGNEMWVSLNLPLNMHSHVQRHDSIELIFNKFEIQPESTFWNQLLDFLLRRDSFYRYIPVKGPVTLTRLRSEPILLTYSHVEIFTWSKRLPMFLGASGAWVDKRPARIIPFGAPRNPFHSK